MRSFLIRDLLADAGSAAEKNTGNYLIELLIGIVLVLCLFRFLSTQIALCDQRDLQRETVVCSHKIMRLIESNTIAFWRNKQFAIP